MSGRRYAIFASTVLVASLTLAGCAGGDGAGGSAGNDGLGYTPTPISNIALGTYDAAGALIPQKLRQQIVDSSGVWEITLDHQVQINRADGGLPVVASRVIYDSDHNDLWITVDGVDIPLNLGQSNTVSSLFGTSSSLSCNVNGVVTPCVQNLVVRTGSYVELHRIDVTDNPAIDTDGYVVFGVKTAIADMPTTGTANYAGGSTASVVYTDALGNERSSFQQGVVTMGVDFGGATDNVTFSSIDATVTNGHTLTGLATIDGNSYSGTMSGTIVGNIADAANTLNVDGTLEGTFYGPAYTNTGPTAFTSETAGVFSVSDTDTDGGTGATGTASGGFLAVSN